MDTWHHIEDRPAYLEKLKRMLRPGGQVVHIDFQKRDAPVGPPTAEKIAREDLVREMEAAGFHLVAEHDFLPHQYFLVFEPRPSDRGNGERGQARAVGVVSVVGLHDAKCSA